MNFFFVPAEFVASVGRRLSVINKRETQGASEEGEAEIKMGPLKAVVIGAGNRGFNYASFALDSPERLMVWKFSASALVAFYLCFIIFSL